MSLHTLGDTLKSTWTPTIASQWKNPPPSAGDARDMGLVPESGRSSAEGNGNPLQHSCHGQRSLAGMVHGAAKNWTRLSVHTQPSHWLKKSSFPAWGLEHINTYEQKAHWALRLFPQRTLQTNHKKMVIWTTNFPDYLPGFYTTLPSHSAGPFPRSTLCQLLGALHYRSLLWVWWAVVLNQCLSPGPNPSPLCFGNYHLPFATGLHSTSLPLFLPLT